MTHPESIRTSFRKCLQLTQDNDACVRERSQISFTWLFYALHSYVNLHSSSMHHLRTTASCSCVRSRDLRELRDLCRLIPRKRSEIFYSVLSCAPSRIGGITHNAWQNHASGCFFFFLELRTSGMKKRKRKNLYAFAWKEATSVVSLVPGRTCRGMQNRIILPL